MKILWTLIQTFVVCSLWATSIQNFEQTTEKATYLTNLPTHTEAIIAQNMLKMRCLTTPKYTDEVEAYLASYLTYGQKDAEDLIGRSVIYFPLIEHYLTQYNLPDELKYLPMIESGLRPYATSTAGAAGLWQFMPPTAREMGLKINAQIDERRDPYKSTEAALTYLSKLYERFESWELALAAYNCGSTKVQRAIRYAGSTDFWKLRRYLPVETRKYIPRLIAASYVAQYYYAHDLAPNFPDFELQWTRTRKVYEPLLLQEIATATNTDITLLKRLNPALRKDVLPANSEGHYLVLPEPAMVFFQTNPKIQLEDHLPGYERSQHVVLVGDTVEKLARIYGCTVEDIKRWNGLKSGEMYYRQALILYRPKLPIQNGRA